MTDVLLALLLLFLPSGVGTRSGFDVQLARPCREHYELTPPITVEILPGPTYRLNGTPLTQRGLDVRLAEVYATRPERLVHIVGHPNVTYQQVITAMDIARGAGARVIVVRTRPGRTLKRCPFDVRYPRSLTSPTSRTSRCIAASA